MGSSGGANGTIKIEGKNLIVTLKIMDRDINRKDLF